MDALERKMRRRIRRQMETGQKQHRVRKLNAETYDDIVRHHAGSLYVVRFRVGKSAVLGRRRLVKI